MHCFTRIQKYTYKTLHILIGAQTIFFLCSLSFLLRLANIQYFLFGNPHVQQSSSELLSLTLRGVSGVGSLSSKANWLCKHFSKVKFIATVVTSTIKCQVKLNLLFRKYSNIFSLFWDCKKKKSVDDIDWTNWPVPLTFTFTIYTDMSTVQFRQDSRKFCIPQDRKFCIPRHRKFCIPPESSMHSPVQMVPVYTANVNIL